MPLMDFLRALSPIGAASSSSTTPATPLHATAGKRDVSLPPSILKATNIQRLLSSYTTRQQLPNKGLSPVSSNASSGGSKKQEGEKSTWENAWEMKRMLKVTVSVCVCVCCVVFSPQRAIA